MKRIDVHYGGNLYSVGGRPLDDVQRDVERAAASGGWLLVNDGEGARRDAYLWVAAGVPLALVPIPDDMD